MKTRAKQLTFVREYLGYTQTELAKSIQGLSQSNLSRFEKGLDIISEDIFLKIVDFLGFPLSFFDTAIGNQVENKHYRKRASVSKKEANKLDGDVRFIGYLIDQMSTSVEFVNLNIQPFNIEEGYSPENAAKYTRESFGLLRDEPVKNIISLLENNGIFVVEIDAIEKFDGVSLITDEGYALIIINKNYPNDRKRFTIAHELGHLILHILGHFPIPDYRDQKERENEANRFASEFLMPSSAIKNSLGRLKLSDLLSLKRYWLASMAAIVRRAYDLRMIDKNRYQYLNIEMSRAGYKKIEPGNVYIDSPSLYMSAYRLHKEELGYSDKELSQVFKIPIEILKNYFPDQNNRLRVRKSLI